MKPAVFKILTLIFLIFSVIACSKNNAGTTVTPPKSNTTLLTQSAWKIQTVALDTNKDGKADLDATASLPACKLDNAYTFKADSTGLMDEGIVKCNSTDPQTVAYTWTFKNNQTILSGTFSFTNGDAKIVSMNDANLIVTYDDNLGTTTTYHIIATLKH